MPTITQHAPGSFCWPELGTTDQNGAKKFYGSLFGWTFNDSPMGPGEIYTIFQLGGRACAALYTLRPDMLKQGVPPHWESYVAVTSADATAAGAEKPRLEEQGAISTLRKITGMNSSETASIPRSTSQQSSSSNSSSWFQMPSFVRGSDDTK